MGSTSNRANNATFGLIVTGAGAVLMAPGGQDRRWLGDGHGLSA